MLYKGLYQSLYKGAYKRVLERIFLLFNQSTQYLTHSGWTPSGVNFDIKVSYSPSSAAIGVDVPIFGDFLRKDASNNLVVEYTDTAAATQTITLSPLTLVADESYDIVISSDGNGVEVSTDVVLVEAGDYLTSNGTDLYADFTPIELSGEFEITGRFFWSSPGTSARFFGNTSGNTSTLFFDISSNQVRMFGYNSSGALAFGILNTSAADIENYRNNWVSFRLTRRSDDFIQLRLNGVLIETSSSSFADDIYIRTFFRRDSIYSASDTILADININNGEYIYKLNDIIDNGGGSGTAPNTGSAGSSFDATVYNYNPLVDLTNISTVFFSASNSAVINPSTLTIDNAMGDGVEYGGGKIWDIEYTDLTLIQGGEFLQGDGNNLTAQLSVDVSVTTPFTLDFIANNTGSAQSLFGGSTTASFVEQSATNTLDYAGVSSVLVDGIARASGALSLVDGQHYKISGVFDNSETVTNILSSSTPGQYFGAIVAGLNINNDDYIYLTKDTVTDSGDGTGLAANTGNVAQYGPDIVNENVDFPGSFAGGQIIADLTDQLLIGKIYQVSATINTLTGSISFSNGGSRVSPAYTTAGDVTWFFVAGGVDLLLVGRFGGGSNLNIDIVARETTNALIQNFTLGDLVDEPLNKRKYLMDQASAIQPNSLEPGTNDATIVNYDPSMVVK